MLWPPVHAVCKLQLSCTAVLQTRLTALDLIGYAAGDERSRQFVHLPEAELEQELLSIKASSHLQCLLLMCICLSAILYLSLAVVLGLVEPFGDPLYLYFPSRVQLLQSQQQHTAGPSACDIAIGCAFGDQGACSAPALCDGLTP